MVDSRSAFLAALLTLAPGCNCHPVTGEPECSAEVMSEALTQVQSALALNTDCTTAADCVLVQSPCAIEATCDFNFEAVNLAGQAAVEHAFSVTAAEVCAACTPDPSVINEGENENGGDCELETPAVDCRGGQCTVIPVPPPCLPGKDTCDADEVCDISGVSTACAGSPFYFAVTGSGSCAEPTDTDEGGACQTNSDCGAGETCVGANPTGFDDGTCTPSCDDGAERPDACSDDCELVFDESGCNYCYCPTGCPGADAGPDGGTADGG